MNKNCYYVYAFYTNNYGVFYIGMGHGTRITNHFKVKNFKASSHILFYRKLNKLLRNNEEVFYKKLKTNLSQKDAWSIEKLLIQTIGRIIDNTGPLCNILEGGCGGINATCNFKRTALYDSHTLNLIQVFNSRIECASYLNLCQHSVANAIIRKSKVINKYYIDNYKENTSLKYIPKNKIPKNYNKIKTKIKLININNGEELKFNSIKETCNFLSIHKQTLRTKLLKNKLINIYKPYYDK